MLIGVPAICLAASVGLGEQGGQATTAQAQAAAPRFEAASVKPCTDSVPGGRKGGGKEVSPSRLDVRCQTVLGMIRMAYVLFGDGHLQPFSRVPVEGGPGWIDSARYAIDSKTEGPESQTLMRGPMMQKLLEERFALKIHRERRQVPVYDLTVRQGRSQTAAVSGRKLRSDRFPVQPVSASGGIGELPNGQRYCRSLGTRKDRMHVVDAEATTIGDFAKIFLAVLDRPVIDRTGLTGKYDIHPGFLPDEMWAGSGAAGPDDAEPTPAGPAIGVALQKQLGLRLQPSKGARVSGDRSRGEAGSELTRGVATYRRRRRGSRYRSKGCPCAGSRYRCAGCYRS